MECPKCCSEMLNNPRYEPEKGIDPAQREYICPNVRCNLRCYKVLNLKQNGGEQPELL